MERGVAHLGHFFVPLFFVMVGAAVDVRVLNPLEPANHQTLLIGGLLVVAAVLGKWLTGMRRSGSRATSMASVWA
jgi:Kef-type K+ transport system membrane component KefB